MNAFKQKTVILIAGPTAVGKTALALTLAQDFNTEIISFDSRQCFQELNIGVAKPTNEELQLVKHHFINSHSIHQKLNAAIFENYALHVANQIFQQKDVLVMVGGTGMYSKVFCEGLDEIPEIVPDIRKQIIQSYEEKGLAWLQAQLQQKDPVFWQAAEQQNPQRLMRALEVIESTGQSITTFRKGKKQQRDFILIKIGLELPRPHLNERIHQRVDGMIEAGLVEETNSLLPYKHINALQTVGYKELFEHFEEKCSLPEAIEKIKIHTCQYAKKQITWFKKDRQITWFSPFQKQIILQYIQEFTRE